MSILAYFATVALIAGASADNFCCSPEKFSAKTIFKSYLDGSFYQGSGEVYYDFAAGMHAAFVNITIDEYKGIFSLVSTLYDVNTGFVYTMTGGVCSKQKLDASRLKETDSLRCIPKTATLDASFAFGGPHEDIELNRYTHRIAGAQRQIIVTNNHCYPTQETFLMGTKTDKGFLSKIATMTTLANLKLTVDDPSVFVLPDLCKKTVMSTKRNNDKNLPVDPWRFVPYLAYF